MINLSDYFKLCINHDYFYKGGLPERLLEKNVTFVCVQYSDSGLYTQLSFYQHIFDVEKAKALLTITEKGTVKHQV